MTFTLVADGSSDKVLVPIIAWAAKQFVNVPINGQWADFSRVQRPRSLEQKIRTALDLYPCDLICVHRDAEAMDPQMRRDEIALAADSSAAFMVPIIPVRMTEAWLFHESAIRCAAGNPNGQQDLPLPPLHRIENIVDPKALLRQAITTASGLNVRRRAGLKVSERIHLIPNYIDDYSFLNGVPSFQQFKDDLRTVLEKLGA